MESGSAAALCEAGFLAEGFAVRSAGGRPALRDGRDGYDVVALGHGADDVRCHGVHRVPLICEPPGGASSSPSACTPSSAYTPVEPTTFPSWNRPIAERIGQAWLWGVLTVWALVLLAMLRTLFTTRSREPERA